MNSKNWQRFTQRARRVLGLAHEEAMRLNHSYIGSEHILIGLLREEGGVAGRVLRELGLETGRVQSMVERLTDTGKRSPFNTPELAPTTKQMLDLAVEEARWMRTYYIGTEHLLLGIARQNDGLAMDVLRRFGVNAEEVRRETHRMLKETLVPTTNERGSSARSSKKEKSKTPMVDQLATDLLLPHNTTMRGHYLDFELQIEPASVAGKYDVSVIASPAGETQQPEVIPFPFDARDMERLQLRLENALLRSRTRSRRALSPEEQEVRRFGQKLFDAVFQRDVRSLFYESRLLADSSEQGVRLKLRIQPPEWARLPWEFLLEPRRDEYICLSRDTPIVRYLELAQPVAPLAVTPPLRILGMVTSPYDLPQLDVALEKRRVEQALAAAEQRGAAIELTWLAGQTGTDLQRALRRAPYHIFHFVGHGSFDAQRDEGVLWLADEQGRARALTATQLALLLGDHRGLRLAVLNACEGAHSSDLDVFSSTAATLVRRGIPAVLAMQYEISDTAAILLAEWFYESLADGLPVDAAVAEARKAISLANDRSLEWGTPVLFMRAKDGRIFDIQTSTAAPPTSPAPVPPQPIPAGRIHGVGEGSSGIPPELYSQLRSVLLDCGPFATDRELRAVFVDKRLAPWQNRLPQADSPAERVTYAIDFLYRQHNDAGESALALLLRALSGRVDSRDACHQRLQEIAGQLERATHSHRGAGLESAPPAPHPDLAAPAANIAIPHIVTGAPPLEMAWCWVPGGKFTMGSNEFDDEKPVHDVPVDGFWLGQYPVTNAQYRFFIEAGGYNKARWWTTEGWQQRQQQKWTEPRFWTEKKWDGAQQPVVGVSWYEAAAFCAWAAEATGESIHLPTEAEWEKGSRGADSRLFPWGKVEPDKKLCNFFHYPT